MNLFTINGVKIKKKALGALKMDKNAVLLNTA